MRPSVSFVSVTQAFNTTTSMGRLTLNVLLSFAQFEREVTAERIRDKIAASKKKGMWMGGAVPLGYRVEHRKLVPVPDEAALVRRIFERYLALGSVSKLKTELDRAGIRTPLRQHRDGSQQRRGRASPAASSTPCSPTRSSSAASGTRTRCIPASMRRSSTRASGRRSRTSSPPTGAAERCRSRRSRPARWRASSSIRMARRCGRPMRSKNGRRYRYYVSRDLVERSVDDGAHGWRIPAGEIESAVAHALAARLRDPDFRSEILRDHQGGADASNKIIGRIAEIAEQLDQPGSARWQDLLRSMISRVDLTGTELRVEASFAPPTIHRCRPR